MEGNSFDRVNLLLLKKYKEDLVVEKPNKASQGTVAFDSNKLLKAVLGDGEKVFLKLQVDPSALELPDDVMLNEYQYFIHKVGFYLVHTITWCRQLGLAIEFISNFDYSKKIDATRADHFIYNLENYLIRLNSVYDRVLQVVNAVFHLCISEENVNHSIIVSNYKVQHREAIHSKIKSIQKYLEKHAQVRHTLIHKHSNIDAGLRRIELFYLADLNDNSKDDTWQNRLKAFRSKYLRDYISKKKEMFSNINKGLFNHLNELFDLLWEEYERQKVKLK